MEAFFFGPDKQQLFGSYHPPLSGDGQVLTVICSPLFSESARTHRALRKLAISIAETGRHVLRFDYRGTGDSFGDLEDYSVSDWVEDVSSAVQEGRKISDCSDVQILAVRAGALLACISLGAASDIQRLVLWDPVDDGAAYIQAIRRAQAENLRSEFRSMSRSERTDGARDIGGWRVSEGMLEEFRALDSSAYLRIPKDKLHVVSTASKGGFLPGGVATEVLPYPCNWEHVRENVINPQPVLERLFECLTKT
jgi:pimeloyl-ACP methyl ester carboxylesterase